MLKKTKIICTQGPATDPDGVVDALIENGMNCARFNFSHGTHPEHMERIKKVRAAAERSGKVISLILDTKGPEMRLGEFAAGKVHLEKGNKFTLTYDDAPGDETHVSVNHKMLYSEVKPGDKLLLSDGLVELVVDEVRGKDIEKEFDTLIHQVTPEDLMEYGIIPEIIGRLPVICTLETLDGDALLRILTEPINAPVRQYEKLLAMDGVELVFTEDALRAVAKKAIERKTGARSLKGIIEEVMLDVMFDIPRESAPRRVTVTKECITEGAAPIIENAAAG